MISAQSFLTASLSDHPQGEAVCRILAAAIQSVDPVTVVKRAVQREGEVLRVGRSEYDLTSFNQIHLLGLGKAAIGMSRSLADLLGSRLSRGLVVTKHVPERNSYPFEIMQGDHPIPGQGSLRAGRKVIEFLSGVKANDLLVCLTSGGGSALLAAPVEGVSLEDMHELTSALLKCGASVAEINTLRRHLDLLKGGGLVKLANDADVINLILSDVVGDRPEAIASGPTAPDSTTKDQAIEVIDQYHLRPSIPASILAALKAGPETPKPQDELFKRVQNIVIGKNLLTVQAALRQAEMEGFHPYLLRTDLQGEAREAAFELATFLRQARNTGEPIQPPACMVAGGELTVTIKGQGRGGRNTELALAAVSELADFPKVMLVTLASDGEDGSTDAAGAVVTGDTYRRAKELGLRGEEYLADNNSYSYFSALGDLLKPGPTGTNVNDLVFLFTFQ